LARSGDKGLERGSGSFSPPRNPHARGGTATKKGKREILKVARGKERKTLLQEMSLQRNTKQ